MVVVVIVVVEVVVEVEVVLMLFAKRSSAQMWRHLTSGGEEQSAQLPGVLKQRTINENALSSYKKKSIFFENLFKGISVFFCWLVNKKTLGGDKRVNKFWNIDFEIN